MSAVLKTLPPSVQQYYEGGIRVVIDGVPCRKAAHFRKSPGRERISKLIAGGVAIAWGDIDEAPRFQFVPNDNLASCDGKPSGRGNFTYRTKWKSRWYRAPSLSLAPSYDVPMLGDDAELTDARKAWHSGDPSKLREWLSERAGERRVCWEAIDACRAVAAFIRACGAFEPSTKGDKMSARREMTANQFKRTREALGWTQLQMAEWAGVTTRTIIRFETGAQPVPRIWRLALESLVTE